MLAKTGYIELSRSLDSKGKVFRILIVRGPIFCTLECKPRLNPGCDNGVRFKFTRSDEKGKKKKHNSPFFLSLRSAPSLPTFHSQQDFVKN